MYIKQATVNNQVRPSCETCYLLYSEGKRIQEHHLGGEGRAESQRQKSARCLSLGIIKGAPSTSLPTGTDEKDAVDALVELISSDFAD